MVLRTPCSIQCRQTAELGPRSPPVWSIVSQSLRQRCITGSARNKSPCKVCKSYFWAIEPQDGFMGWIYCDPKSDRTTNNRARSYQYRFWTHPLERNGGTENSMPYHKAVFCSFNAPIGIQIENALPGILGCARGHDPFGNKVLNPPRGPGTKHDDSLLWTLSQVSQACQFGSEACHNVKQLSDNSRRSFLEIETAWILVMSKKTWRCL